MAQITEYRRQRIRRELEMTKERLELYLAREKEMLSKDGVQLYTIGSRNGNSGRDRKAAQARGRTGGRVGRAKAPACGGRRPPRLVNG